MLLNNSRNELRNVFFEAWRKHQAHESLEAIEQQIIHIILQHPEYQQMLSDVDKYLERDYLPEFGETNPFLHMALHLSLQEQLSTDRPAGIVAIFQSLLTQYQDVHRVEHLMIDCIAEGIWMMQQDRAFTDADYLALLQRILK